MVLPQNYHPNGGYGEWESFLGPIDRRATKFPAKPGPYPASKPRAEKRRKVDDPAQEAARGPDEAQSSAHEGLVQEMLLICMLATKVVVSVFWVRKCLSMRSTETK